MNESRVLCHTHFYKWKYKDEFPEEIPPGEFNHSFCGKQIETEGEYEWLKRVHAETEVLSEDFFSCAEFVYFWKLKLT